MENENKWKYTPRPDYHFEISNGVAKGVLPDGTPFLIDEDKVPLVSERRFHINEKGYVCSKERKNNNKVKLHWYVLGYTERPDFIVDHINRDKTDCRVSNLRKVTNQQNSWNRKLSKANTSGYKGVFFSKKHKMYVARIGYKMRGKIIYKSLDPIECAKAYNYASKILHKEYAGYQNPVDEASENIKAAVFKVCTDFFVDF